jgi:hypothetical protein
MSVTPSIADGVQELVEVEKRADVNALTFGGACIWPIVRRIQHFSRVQKDTKQPTALPEIGESAFSDFMLRMDDSRLDRAADLETQKAVLAGEKPCDALFISRLLDHTDQVNGLHYNRFTDPFIQMLRDTGAQHLKLEISDHPAEALADRYEPTVPLQLPAWQSPEFLTDLPEGVAGYAAVAEAFAQVSRQPPTFDHLASYLPRLWSRRNYFARLLRRIRPRAVCVICYYSADILALVWACRMLGIPTVDIQHGQKGPNHGMYNQWHVMPQDGYALLPDYFFCWGASEKNLQEATLPALRLRPFSIISGNPWIGLWKQEGAITFSDRLAAFCSDIKERKAALVGLQPIEPLIPSALPGAMRRTPDWVWLLRLHPHQRYRLPEVIAHLTAGGVTNYEVELSTMAPLYALLRNCDRLLTPWSSVASEALTFDLPVTIIDARGYDVYKHEIDTGVMSHAVTADDIARAVTENKPAQRSGDARIESSLDLARQALATVLS